MRGSVVPAITPHIIMAFLIGVIAVLCFELNLFGDSSDQVFTISMGPFTAIGVAISLFLGFHNNASYSRWWEARILWGTQVIVVRNLARFLIGIMDNDVGAHASDKEYGEIELLDESSSFDGSQNLSSSMDNGNDIEHNMNARLSSMKSEGHARSELSCAKSSVSYTTGKLNDPAINAYSSWQSHIVYLGVAHSHAFRSQMRPSCKMDGSTSALDDRDRFLNPQEKQKVSSSKNPANIILLLASNILGKAHRSKEIDTYSMIHVQKILDSMCEIQTACERIHNTPLPLAYSLLVHRTTVLYVIMLPFAIAKTQGWWTPVFTAFVAYTYFGLDQLAKEIQEPMKDRPMCLALSAICRTIEIDALEALGEKTPSFLKAERDVLM